MALGPSFAVRLLIVSFSIATATISSAQNCAAGPAAGRSNLALASGVVSVAALRVPQGAWAHLGRAAEAAHLGQEAQFSREIDQALKIAPTFAEAYLLRASWEVALRRNQAAIEDVLLAQQLRPGIFWGGVILAGAYNGLRRYADAATVLQGLRNIEHDTWQAKYEMARAAIGLKDASEALRWGTAAFRSAPENCLDARLLLADGYLLTHRWTDAMTQLQSYIDSKLPQDHRAEVLAMMERIRLRVEQEEHSNVALAEPARTGSSPGGQSPR